MRSDADNDTRSPWYDAFAPRPEAPADVARSVAAAVAGPAPAAKAPAAKAPATDADSATEALFDCYNA